MSILYEYRLATVHEAAPCVLTLYFRCWWLNGVLRFCEIASPAWPLTRRRWLEGAQCPATCYMRFVSTTRSIQPSLIYLTLDCLCSRAENVEDTRLHGRVSMWQVLRSNQWMLRKELFSCFFKSVVEDHFSIARVYYLMTSSDVKACLITGLR